MQYHAIQCNTMQYHAIPCNTMQYHSIPCNSMQCHAIPCNTMQYHAITADGAYHCPVGSIRPFLSWCQIVRCHIVRCQIVLQSIFHHPDNREIKCSNVLLARFIDKFPLSPSHLTITMEVRFSQTGCNSFPFGAGQSSGANICGECV